jgi:hypothetical protein
VLCLSSFCRSRRLLNNAHDYEPRVHLDSHEVQGSRFFSVIAIAWAMNAIAGRMNF